MNPIVSGIKLELTHVICAMCGSPESSEANPVFEGYDYEYHTCDNRLRFVACAECGHVYLSPRCKTEDIDKIYPDFQSRSRAKAYRVSSLAAWFKRYVFDRRWMRNVLANVREGSRVLEIGAGSGSQLMFLADMSPETPRFCQ